MNLTRIYASLWHAKNAKVEVRDYFPQLNSEIGCEVCVVGGGITGITLAYLLALEGVDVVVLEASKVGFGSTGGSTAHLDPLTDMMLKDLVDELGVEKAKLVIKSNLEAMAMIESNVKRYAIDCGFEKVTGAYLAQSDQEAMFLHEEMGAALELDLSPSFERNPELPFACKARLNFQNHARFDPLVYVTELSKAAKRAGARIFEKSRVREFADGRLRTDSGVVRAKQVVLATHIPIGLHPVTQSRLIPMRSYVLGARVEGEIEDGVFWDLDSPYQYIRKAWDEKGELLLVGGADHRTGEPANDPYEKLRHYIATRFDLLSIDYAWSEQYYESADGLPLIGKFVGEDNLWYASGFEGNGMTFGTVAAKLLADLIMERSSQYQHIYTPMRFNLGVAGKNIVAQNLTSAKDFIMDRLSTPKKTPEDIRPGEGAIVNFEGEQMACYRDIGGDLYAMSPVCPHAKCHVRWNGVEKSWDCPCHGGRFSATGEVLNGPPTENLKKVDVYVARPEDEPPISP